MHSVSRRGSTEPTGAVLKSTKVRPPSWYQTQPFGPGAEIGPAYVFPLAAAATLQATAVAIGEKVAGHLLLFAGAQV